MIEFENDFLHIWIDRHIDLMHSEWLRSVNSEEYRLGNWLFIKMLKKYFIKYWIVDSSKLGDISDEDEEWTLKVLVPEIVQSGVTKLARVSGENKPSYNKFETFSEKAAESYIGNVEVRQFMTYKEAADWMGEIRI